MRVRHLLTATAATVAIGFTIDAAHATHEDFDEGCIAVVIDEDDEIIDPNTQDISFTTAAQRFYETHGDDYDFLMFLPNFNHPDGSFSRILANDIEGIGLDPMNRRAVYGVPDDGRVQSLTNYVNFTTFPMDPEARLSGGLNNDSTLSLLAQEVGHRWGAFVTHAAGDNSILGRGGAHWSYYLHAPSTGTRMGASSLEGNSWQDNSDGTFTTLAQTDGYSELDQYLMGLRAASAVIRPMFFIDDPSGGRGKSASGTPFRPAIESADTVSGTRVDFTINDIIDTNGARDPSAAEAPKNFTQAFILLAQEGAMAGDLDLQEDIDRLDDIRIAWEAYFSEETDFLGTVDGCIFERPVDVVFLVDISASFTDDLPVLKANTPDLVQNVLDVAPSSRFALATFSDFPIMPFGDPGAGDIAYRLDLPLTNDSDAVIDAVNDLTTLSGLDLPQSQYEALFQVLTGAGADLNGNGDFTDVGDIEPSDINADPLNPMFIFLFTDATFHDSDVEPDYPGVGRSAVLGELTATPFVFGLVSGDGDNPDMQELADVTGGSVFVLGPDSSGFEAAVGEAIETTEPPPSPTVSMLSELTVERAEVNWELDDVGTEGLAAVDIRGTFTLPNDADDGLTFDMVSPVAVTNVYIGERFVLDADIPLDVRRRGGTLWVAQNEVADRGLDLRIDWLTPKAAEYRFRGLFDPTEFAVSGDTEAELTFVFSLGDELLTRDVSIVGEQWDLRTTEHWRKKKS